MNGARNVKCCMTGEMNDWAVPYWLRYGVELLKFGGQARCRPERTGYLPYAVTQHQFITRAVVKEKEMAEF